MLLLFVLQLFLVGSSAAALGLRAQIQRPFDIISGNRLWKHFPAPEPSPDKTIYETVANDGRFSYLTRAIAFVGDEIIDVLNDVESRITFFAVPDKALRHGRRSELQGERGHGAILELALAGTDIQPSEVISIFGNSAPDLAAIVSAIDQVNDPFLDDGPGDEKRRKIIRLFLKALLQYHVLPLEHDLNSLLPNTTYPTHLHVPLALGGHAQRIHVSHKFKRKGSRTLVNYVSKIVDEDVRVKNGIIHTVDHPLIPPPPIFQELFFMQRQFSTFTSALQRTGLTDDLDLRYVWSDSEKKGHLEGTTAVTVFAVPNKVFDRLPERVRSFLFSPFGTRALRKLLEYHIVPGIVAHSDFFFNQTAKTEILPEPRKRCVYGADDELKKGHPHREPVSSINAVLGTRLPNHTLYWQAEKSKISYPGHGKRHGGFKHYETIVRVNGDEVKYPDGVGLNGVVHVVDRLLFPCPQHGSILCEVAEHDEVGDWQKWE